MLRRLVLALVLVTVLSLSGASAVFACYPGTSLTIDASALEVSPGDNVDLTIEEENTGDEPDAYLTDVFVELDDGITIVTLDHTSGWFDASSDVNNPGILDWDETWRWVVTVTVVADTTYTATGHGFYEGTDITIPDYPEQDSVTVRVTNGNGGQGLTPGYWKNHLDMWPAAYSPTDNYLAIFGVGPDVSLLEALMMKGGHFNALTRHSAAAIQNAEHSGVDYPLTVADIIALVNDAYSSGDWESAKNTLNDYNELGGDL